MGEAFSGFEPCTGGNSDATLIPRRNSIHRSHATWTAANVSSMTIRMMFYSVLFSKMFSRIVACPFRVCVCVCKRLHVANEMDAIKCLLSVGSVLRFTSSGRLPSAVRQLDKCARKSRSHTAQVHNRINKSQMHFSLSASLSFACRK